MIGLLVLALLEAVAPTARRPVGGGTLRVAVAEPIDGVDPTRAMTAAEWQVVSLVHAGLFRIDASGEVRPDLASGLPEALEGGRRFRIALRTARYHDGSAFKASHVVAAFAALKGGPLAPTVQGLATTASGDQHLDLNVGAATSAGDLARRLAHPALVIARGADGTQGLGPFRIARWLRASLGASGGGEGRVELVRHNGFHRGQPYLEGITVATVWTAADVIHRFHYGEADLVFEDSDRYEKAIRITAPGFEEVGFWVLDPAKAARLSAAVPRAELVRRLSGATALAGPRGTNPSAWFVGVADWVLEPARTALSTPTAWPIEPLDRAAIAGFLRGCSPPGRAPDVNPAFDAILVPWAGSSDLAGCVSRAGGAWVPVARRTRTAVFRPRLHGAYFLPTGAVDLAGAFLP